MYDILVKNLSVYYGPVCALQNINLRIKKNELLVITGPNGGGKTTLLKVLLGMLQPTSGHVLIDQNVPIGYVPQFVFFDRDFPINTFDAILMARLPKKIKLFQSYLSEDKKKAESIMDKLGILELKKRQIGQLSGGQLQKVLIARALIRDPEVLILDEPTSNLDFKVKEEIYKILPVLKENMTILIVSHEMKEILPYVDSIAYVNKILNYYENNIDFQKIKFS